MFLSRLKIVRISSKQQLHGARLGRYGPALSRCIAESLWRRVRYRAAGSAAHAAGRRGGPVMTAGETGRADGETHRHVPVLARTAVDMLGVRSGEIYIDGTFGAGGYSRIILETPGAQVLAIDRDRAAVAGGAEIVAQAQGRLTLAEGRFSALDDVARQFGHAAVDGVVLDLGVSSMQLDEAERGFSFRHRRSARHAHGRRRDRARPTWWRTLASATSPTSFTGWARSAVRARWRAPSSRRASGNRSGPRARWPTSWRKGGARQARAPSIRRRAPFRRCASSSTKSSDRTGRDLAAAERILKPAGRLAVVSFHSLEDRIVKTFLNERSRAPGTRATVPEAAGPAPSFRLLTRRPREPGEAEVAGNPRARSAKLRAAEAHRRRGAADSDVAALLPRLPSLADTREGAMSMRLLNVCVLVLLVAAAVAVYEIKFESTLRAERVAKLRADVRRERDAIAALRAEWAALEKPARMQGLVRRHLPLGPAHPTQFDSLDRLPPQPPKIVQPPRPWTRSRP
jgi:16S rRNA (cytosine1402-N4)-methyltransferase